MVLPHQSSRARVVTNASGAEVFFPRDYLANVGFGLIPGHRRVTALGQNDDVDTATFPEDVWSGGGLYPFLTAATALEVVSSSANDAEAGTGARTIVIAGLDANYMEVSQTITLNGTTPVAIPTSLIAVNQAVIASAGSGNINAGTINIRDVSGGTVRAIIPLGIGITRQCIYTVPAGHTLQIISSFFCFNRVSASTRFASFSSFVRQPSGLYRMPFELSVGDEPPYRHDAALGIIVPEKNSFSWRCTFTSSNDSNMTAGLLGVLKDNTVS